MSDKFENRADYVSAPATRFASVTPSDSADLSELPKALYVGIGGALVLRGADGTAVTFTQVVGGTVLPVRARRVQATGTTAGAIVALY